ncbi:MAG: hypothetical protein INQ03_07135 [Candidatus Heimdallarchaeota archaeon]|nr:hypothetical protein [Candidatus Heimdallarchaeota archaeon]
MSRKHLLPVEHDEYLERIGLTDTDKKVYIATLDSGLVSVGEIQQLTKISDLSYIIDSIRDLIDIGLIKKALGRMPRYYAILPFMRETITIEREFTLALDSMIQSIQNTRNQIADERESLLSVGFPRFVQDLLDSYYHDILEPSLKEFEAMKSLIEDEKLHMLRSIQDYNGNLGEEINLMLKPINNYARTVAESTETLLSNVDRNLEDILVKSSKKQEETLKKAFINIKDHLEKFNQYLKLFGKEIIDSLLPLEMISQNQKIINKDFTTIEDELNSEINNLETFKQNILAEMITAKTKFSSILNTEEKNELTLELERKMIQHEDVDSIFDTLVNNVKSLEFTPSNFRNIIASSKKNNLELEGIGSVHDDILLKNTKRAAEFGNYLTDLGKLITQILNTINEDDTQNHAKLSKSITELFLQLVTGLDESSKAMTEKVETHHNKITSNQDIISNKWENKINESFNIPLNIVSPIIDTWIDKLTPAVDTFKDRTNEMITDITNPLLEFEKESISAIIERIRFVKVMVEGRSKDLSSIIEFAKSFDYTKSSDTWVVVGLPSIYSSLTDMILRTRVKVTIVIPNIDLELIEIIRKIRSTIRITIVTDIDIEKDKRFISKMKDTGRVNLRSYDRKNLYACMRDSEEIIFGYQRMDEEMVGIRSSTPSIVELLEDRLNETVIRNSKSI